MAAHVVRVWKGYGTADSVERYCDNPLPDHRAAAVAIARGFYGATVLVRSGANETQVVVATVWASLDAIKTFAGEDYEQAVVEPAVRDLLDRCDDHVAHFTVAVAT